MISEKAAKELLPDAMKKLDVATLTNTVLFTAARKQLKQAINPDET